MITKHSRAPGNEKQYDPEIDDKLAVKDILQIHNDKNI